MIEKSPSRRGSFISENGLEGVRDNLTSRPLILLGLFGIFAGGFMFGDIGIAAMIGAGAALLAGIGLLGLARRVAKLEKVKE
ncbi:MAG: hypothetical protein OXH85_02415 [Truepera sp.]|nr:hypothetical protein [Truepera sp.]